LKVSVTILLLFIANTVAVFADNFDDSIQKGNEHYANNQFVEALNAYDSLIKDNVISYGLYYNLACTYFQLDSLAQSIYYFEKARLINSKDDDLNHNLSLAYGNQQDDIDKFPELFITTFFKKIANFLSSNLWLILAIVSLWFAVACFYLRGVGKAILKNRNLHIYSLLFGLTCFLMAYLNYTFNYNQQEAIVFNETVAVYKSPNTDAENLFDIHEGLKVFILDEVDMWYQIKMTDNTKGWLNKSAVKLL